MPVFETARWQLNVATASQDMAPDFSNVLASPTRCNGR